MDDQVKVKITEEPNTVAVTYQGRTVAGTWDFDEEGNAGLTEVVHGVDDDKWILNAALYAWGGDEDLEFTLGADELADEGGGFWSPD